MLCTWGAEEGLPRRLEAGKSSKATYTHSVTRQLIHHTVPLLVARMTRHEREIYAHQDHMDKLPLERLETMQQEIDGSYTISKATQEHVETLQATLQTSREEITDLQFHLDESEAREADLTIRIQALEESFGPSRSRPSDKEGYAGNEPYSTDLNFTTLDLAPFHARIVRGSECLTLKNQNERNQNGRGGARGRAFVIGGGEAC
ncbi:hypothetical protein Tco_0849308 [Tanacetum coccineum]